MKKKTPKVSAPIENKTMSEHRKTSQSAHPASYPKKTTGSEVSAEVRKEANQWTDQERAALFERGMQIIYGGSGNNKSKVCSRLTDPYTGLYRAQPI